MPFDNTGTFIRVHNWTEDKSNNIPITASRMDAEDNGFADGLSQTFLRDGSVALTGDLKAGNHKLTGLRNGTENTDAATVGQLNTVQGNAVLLTGDQTVAGVKTFTSSPVVPTVSADDSSTKVATTAWVNSIGNNVVHKAGNETINGTKTFEVNGASADAFVIKNKAIDLGTIPSNSIHTRIYFKDKNGNNAACLFSNVSDIGNNSLMLQATKNGGNYELTTMGLVYPPSGNPYAFAPTPDTTTGSSSTQIATTGWVNKTGNNVVHLTDNETINGVKTFINGKACIRISRGSEAYTEVMTTKDDANYTRTGGFRNIEENGINESLMYVTNDDGSAIVEKISILRNTTTGDVYTRAPVPTDTTSLNSQKIATTGWVNSTGNNVVHLTGNETINGAKTFTSDVNIKNDVPIVYLQENDVVKGTNPANEQAWAIHSQDSVGNDANHRIGSFTTRLSADGTTWSGIIAFKNEADSTVSSSIRVYYPTSGSPYTYAPTPTDTTPKNSTQIATTGWVNSTGNNVVHLTDNEIITGTKTFAGDGWITHIKNTEVTYNTAPATHVSTAIIFTDKNNTQMGVVECFRNPDNSTLMHFNVYGPNGAWASHDLQLRVASDGTTTAHAPNPPSASNDTNIATTKWVNSIDNNVVHKTGNETINGGKTFFGGITRANKDITKGTAPSSGINTVIAFTDKNDKSLGYVFHRYEANKDSRIILQATKANASGDADTASISICYPASGNPYGEAPASDVNGSIVTTVNKSKSQNGYFKLGNGLIIQWGRVTASNVALTITLPTAFSSATSYSISAITNNGKAAFTQAQTPTTFHLDASGGIGSTSFQWVAIGY